MNYNTIIFDLDGTLLDTLSDLSDSVNYALTKLNFETRTTTEICSFIGNGVERLIELSLPENTSSEIYDECLLVFKNHYSTNLRNKTKPYNGTIEVLQNLKENNYKLAIVSNKFQDGVENLSNYYFNYYIDLAIGHLPERRKKPYPDALMKAIDDLNVDKNNCLYIGDSEVDFETAKNCGVDFVGVTWGFRNRALFEELGSKFIIDNPLELISILND